MRADRAIRSGLTVGMAALLLASAAPALPAPPAAVTGFPAGPTAPAGAPNVLIVMTDDVGFAAPSTFGGGIPTPNLDALAAGGLRYVNFHTTALCSPSRAALLTGRNHHAVGAGHVPELATGEPGYTSVLPPSAATFARVLGRSGYASAFLGKHHNVPSWEDGPSGPFDRWATGLGFDYFYGFHGGMTNQFSPDLIENRTPVDTPREAGYFLDRDLADHAIDWLATHRASHQGRPFLLYLAPGTAHAPLQAPAEWLARFRGKFDAGWDAYRAETFARQKAQGLIPANAVLPPLPPGIAPWATLSAKQKAVYARYMEAYAAALACFDDQFGRVIAALRQSGELDNTLVLFISGDNGATPEGGANGAMNYLGRTAPDKELDWAYDHLDQIGGPNSYPVGSAGWAVALNTPWPYYKVVASRLGGITNGMVVSWPARIKTPGIRHQWLDLTDIAPTLYQAIGVTAPAVVDGVRQMPLDGASFLATLADPDAPSPHPRQYFEINGNAAIYDRGWLLATRMQDSTAAGNTMPDLAAPWQLYDLANDPTQTVDVAGRYPARAKALRALFDAEARRNHVLPLQTTSGARLSSAVRPEPGNAAGRYIYRPGRWVFGKGTFPSLLGRDWTISADVTVPADGLASGTLVTQGGRFQGWGLLVHGGIPAFVYRTGDMPAQITRVARHEALSPGAHRISVSLARDAAGQGGELRLTVDGQPADAAHVPQVGAFMLGNEPVAIGRDTGTTVDGDPLPFAWRGDLTVTLDMGPIAGPPALLPGH